MPEYLKIQPSPISLIESLREIGYSMETAIADIMDNSITSDASSIHLRYFLSSSRGKKNLRISINGDFLEAFDPFNPSNLATRELSEQKIYLHNEQITVQPYVLPHYNKVSREEYEKYAGDAGYLQNQGFYVYRNRRLIIKSTWFRLIPREELTKWLRVRIDIPNTLDHLWN
ncbi:MAG: hypothetical protein ACXW0H_10130 [Methylobacter sp.]